jgi:hypothetical protein
LAAAARARRSVDFHRRLNDSLESDAPRAPLLIRSKLVVSAPPAKMGNRAPAKRISLCRIFLSENQNIAYNAPNGPFRVPPMTKPAAEIAKISWPIGADFFSFSVTSR